ncbi:MAG TPA: alkaline phosphatase [Chthoniobacterales bacterium]|nr:alkaline phosphatase [Chthoniobacterales bacterium]
MKWRNQLLALFCLLAFAGLGILYFQHWVVQKPFGIVLLIGEGLTPHRLAATRVFAGGADARLVLDSMPHFALLSNASKDFATPDQSAAATALATGVKVKNRALSVNAEGRALITLLDLARDRGRATGLITNAQITDPTAAAFYAHSNDSADQDGIAGALSDASNIDLVMGGGVARFLPETKGGERQDGRDLLLELRRNGYDIVKNRAELEGIPAWRRAKLFGAFAPNEMAFANQIEERSDQPSLADMVRRAVELLQYNPGGYLLVVDAGLMRKAAVANQAERTFSETIELDRALATARRYAGPKSTIIACGDVGIGGLSLNGFPFRKDSGLALLGLNSAGQPWLTWATGPNGIGSYGSVKNTKPDVENGTPPPPTSGPTQVEPAAVFNKSALNTVDDVAAFGAGPGSETLQGVLENTVVFRIIRDKL